MTHTESGIHRGTILGMIIHGKVRNLIVVDSVSNGVVKGRALIGQHAIYFSEADDGSGAVPRPSRPDGNLFSGRWADAAEIVRNPRLPADMAAAILEIDAAMHGQSVKASIELAADHHETISSAMEFVERERHERTGENGFRP